MNIESKVAVVSGASKGLGAACAEALVGNGATVFGLARNEKDLHKLHGKLGESFVPVVVDLTDQTAVANWISETFNEKFSPDILLNNAGAGYFGRIDELTLEQWHQMINTNLNGVFYLTSGLVPFMKRHTATTHIINIGSILGKTGGTERSGYCATKFGIQGFSEALAKELRNDLIKVTCLNPGSIETDFFKESGVKANNNMLHPDDLADLVIYLLKTPDNFLVDELTVRPLLVKGR